jgi:hypothetical protein
MRSDGMCRFGAAILMLTDNSEVEFAKKIGPISDLLEPLSRPQKNISKKNTIPVAHAKSVW